MLGDLVIVSRKLAIDFPGKTLNAVLGEKEGKLFDDFSYLFITNIDEIVVVNRFCNAYG